MEAGIGQEFVERTKHKHLEASGQCMEEGEPPIEARLPKGGAIDPLPKPEAIATDLRRIIEGRTSVRTYQTTPLSKVELSYLLWCTQGVKEVDYGHTFRTVPSAGARHALETILLVNRVEGLSPGLYRYRPLKHAIEDYALVETASGEVTQACFQQAFVAHSAATFIWVAIPGRMTWRYDQRGYRYLFLDAGHVCQNLYLAAESIGCGACAVAAYDDDRMNEILGLDGVNAFVIYLASVGKKRP